MRVAAPASVPMTRDLVLLGGGHTHALVLRAWAMRPLPGARLTLVNPGPTAPYTGMLPGLVEGLYARDDLDIDLVRLARAAGARLILDRACGPDLAARTVRLEKGMPVPFDLLSIDVGVTSALPDVPGAGLVVPAKPLDAFADRWAGFLDAAVAGGPADAAVIGGGVAGVELAVSMARALARAAPGRATVALIARGALLGGLPAGVQTRMRDALRQAGVTVHDHATVTAVTADAVLTEAGPVPSRFTVGAAGARPHDWLAATGLPQRDGYLTVDAFLRSTGDPGVYAAGDCADFAARPLPKAGVHAVRQAPVLLHNLRAELTGAMRRPYRPQRDFLKLISTGDRGAIGTKWGLSAQGTWVWRWKDAIDRRFMDRFRDLPAMALPPAPQGAARGVAEALGTAPPCGGCGSKVAQGTLAAALARLPTPARPDIESVAGDDAAVIVTGGLRQVLTTDHLRAFALDPRLVARVAAVHALSDIRAMGARPQAALAQMILPPLSPALQARWLDEIMAEAGAVLAAAGAPVVGGHTTVGAELTLGFTVTGLCEAPPITLAGARPGDALVLTKPIGTGVVLAAEMQGRAPGAAVVAAWASMADPQPGAGPALADAHAMTDVTGFGLAGHLLNLCDASGVGARIALDAVPFLPGALTLSQAGIASTLFPANRAAAGPRMTAPDDPRVALLFDPQTGGGLLAAVPPDGLASRL
ncbi:MAG: selenide, water dikinase SelD, partial [Rhodobacteraceae bacterium]|nr:selenide, water dikinase SelD [Paracoccaceae bacterium]